MRPKVSRCPLGKEEGPGMLKASRYPRNAQRTIFLVLAALLAATGAAWPADPPVPPPPATGNQWSIVVLPDPQAYNQTYDLGGWVGRGYQYKERFVQQVQWIVANRDKYNIRFAACTGDHVQDCGFDPVKAADPNSADAKKRGEWLNAVAALNCLHRDNDPNQPALVPYALAIGNHDYHSSGPSDLTSTEYERFLGPGRFREEGGSIKPAVADWYKADDKGWEYRLNGRLVATGVGRNSCQVFSAAGTAFLHLTLECAATDEAIAWAKTVLEANPGKPVIVTTHAFIDGGGNMRTGGGMGRQVGGPNPTNDSQQIFDKLIKDEDRIFLVICGHCFWHGHAILKNATGNDVHVHEACYHLNTAGGRIDVTENPGTWAYKGGSDTDRNGSGWLGMLLFDPDANKITWFTYSPVLDVWATDAAPGYKGRTFPVGDKVVEECAFDFKARFR
jgi:hypothetical protein